LILAVGAVRTAKLRAMHVPVGSDDRHSRADLGIGSVRGAVKHRAFNPGEPRNTA